MHKMATRLSVRGGFTCFCRLFDNYYNDWFILKDSREHDSLADIMNHLWETYQDTRWWSEMDTIVICKWIDTNIAHIIKQKTHKS